MIIYKDKRPISFENAYKKKSVKEELKGEREHLHGLVRPFSIHQVFTWIFLSANLVYQVILLILCPQGNGTTDLTTKIVLAVACFLVDALVFYLGLLTTKTDPSDRTVHLERYHRLTAQKFDDSEFQYYCNYCDTNVK